MKPEVMAGLAALSEWAQLHPEASSLLKDSIAGASEERMASLIGAADELLKRATKAADEREYRCCVELAGPSFRPCLIGFGEDDYPLREKLKRGLGKVVYVTVRIQDEQPEEV